MIIELPKEFSFEGERKGQKAYIENNVLKLTRQVSFRELMVEITYQMKGRNKCWYCKQEVSEGKITIDHMFPVDFGGPTITNNLLPACKRCNNQKKRNMTYEQYISYLEAESLGLEKEYLKDLRQYQKQIRKKQLNQLPKEWITETQITDIITTINLMEDYKSKKYLALEKYYLKYGVMKKPIVVDKNSFLLDGFLVLMLAKNYNINIVPTIILENVEVIF